MNTLGFRREDETTLFTIKYNDDRLSGWTPGLSLIGFNGARFSLQMPGLPPTEHTGANLVFEFSCQVYQSLEPMVGRPSLWRMDLSQLNPMSDRPGIQTGGLSPGLPLFIPMSSKLSI